jgi:endogenous inhibitor of DNA gyrase (YacG/DUF329 family)
MPGEVKLEKVTVHCPGCGETVEAVAQDGVVKGYCAKARKIVEALIILH